MLAVTHLDAPRCHRLHLLPLLGYLNFEHRSTDALLELFHGYQSLFTILVCSVFSSIQFFIDMSFVMELDLVSPMYYYFTTRLNCQHDYKRDMILDISQSTIPLHVHLQVSSSVLNFLLLGIVSL